MVLTEAVEKALGGLRELSSDDLAANHRVLTSLSGVCERLFGWSREPSQSELERMKNGTINLTLIRTPRPNLLDWRS